MNRHVLEDLFHHCALAAYVDQAIEDGKWPDPIKVKYRAYRYYERELQDDNQANR